MMQMTLSVCLELVDYLTRIKNYQYTVTRQVLAQSVHVILSLESGHHQPIRGLNFKVIQPGSKFIKTTWSQGYKTFIMLDSIEHEFYCLLKQNAGTCHATKLLIGVFITQKLLAFKQW